MTTTKTRQPMSTSSLTGNEIKNQQNEVLGSVHDIMLDCSSGRVAYVVMTSGGFLGMGNKLFAIPMSALTLDTECECFRMEATKETFDAADGFDKDNWPDFACSDFEETTHARYSAKPYWN
jgi:sporulation protein YlmC with PRC-barrel domain